MAFAERINKSGVGLIYFASISGLPFFFSNTDEPSDWIGSTFGGETYEWVKCLFLKKLSPIKTKMDPWQGVGSGGNLKLEFDLNAIWESILARQIDSDVSVMIEDLSAYDTSAIHMDRRPSSWPEFNGVLYVGLETIGYLAENSPDVEGLTRGLYGSQPLYHSASPDSSFEIGQSGPYISLSPLAMRGRILTLYIAPGFVGYEGKIFPFGSGPGDLDENSRVFRGPILVTEEKIGQKIVEISTGDLMSLFDREVATRLPKFNLGHADSKYLVQIDSASNRFAFSYFRDDVKYSSSALSLGLADGLYTLATIATTLTELINDTLHDYGLSSSITFLVTLRRSAENVVTITVKESPHYSEENNEFSFLFPANIGEANLLLELGFEGAETSTPTLEYVGTGPVYDGIFTFEASKTLPRFRLPQSNLRSRVYFRQTSVLPVKTTTGWGVAAHLLINEEIVKTTSTVGTENLSSYVDIERAQCGTHRSAVYVEQSDDELEGVQVLAFPEMEWRDSVTYLALGGQDVSAYGGWPGFGAGIDPTLFYFPSMTTTTTTIVVTEATTLADIISPLMIADQIFAVPTPNRIEFGKVDFVLPTEEEALESITFAQLYETINPKLDSHEDGVVNVIKFSDVGYNPGTGDGGELIYRDGNSIATWGIGESLEISFQYAIGDEEDLRRHALNTCLLINSRYGRPWRTIELEIQDAALAWLANIGEHYKLELSPLLDESYIGMLIEKGPIFYSKKETHRGTLTFVLFGVSQALVPAGYSPTLRVIAVSGTTLTISPSYYSDADLDYFSVGDEIRFYSPGEDDAAVDLVITQIGSTGTSLRVDVALSSPTLPAIIELRTKPALYCYLSDGIRESDARIYG